MLLLQLKPGLDFDVLSYCPDMPTAPMGNIGTIRQGADRKWIFWPKGPNEPYPTTVPSMERILTALNQ